MVGGLRDDGSCTGLVCVFIRLPTNLSNSIGCAPHPLPLTNTHALFYAHTYALPQHVHAGDQDLICNWLGNRRWVDELEWSGSQGWSQAQVQCDVQNTSCCLNNACDSLKLQGESLRAWSLQSHSSPSTPP